MKNSFSRAFYMILRCRIRFLLENVLYIRWKCCFLRGLEGGHCYRKYIVLLKISQENSFSSTWIPILFRNLFCLSNELHLIKNLNTNYVGKKWYCISLLSSHFRVKQAQCSSAKSARQVVEKSPTHWTISPTLPLIHLMEAFILVQHLTMKIQHKECSWYGILFSSNLIITCKFYMLYVN